MSPHLSTPWRAAMLLATLSAVPACGADDSGQDSANLAVSRTALSAVPSPEQPGHGDLGNVFVGLDDDGALALSIAETPDGRLLAYACDGESLGVWLEGAMPSARATEAKLAGEAGELTLRSTSRMPLSDALRGGIDFVVTARFDEIARSLSVAPAEPTAGMYRYAEVDGGETHTASWVVLNDGRVFGVDDGGGAVKSRLITAGSDVDDTVAAPVAGNGTVETDEYIFNRFRCGRLLLKYNRLSVAAGPYGLVGSQFMSDFVSGYQELDCKNHGYPNLDWMVEGQEGGLL